MDERTADFYRRYADESVVQAEALISATSVYFDTAFAPGAKVLDVGAGSGRDTAVLLARGHDAYGVEPNAAMRAVALRLHPELADRLVPGELPDIGQPFGGQFDGVVCAAVLMHLSEADVVASLRGFAAVLAPTGRVLLSVPAMASELLDAGRDRDQRRFSNHAPAMIESAMQRLAFARIGQWIIDTVDTRWTVLLFER